MLAGILVVGDDVLAVQKVSRHCLAWCREVVPSYGVPEPADLELFDPELVVVCSPLSEPMPTHHFCIQCEAGGGGAWGEALDEKLRSFFTARDHHLD